MINEYYTIWQKWEETIHFQDEQLKRQKKAVESDITPLIIENGVGSFRGTKSDYVTTLSECSCTDFIRRNIPCKHMYRLAHELNVFALSSVQSNLQIIEKLRIDDVMKSIDTLKEEYQKILMRMAYECGNSGDSDGYILKDKDVANVFLELKLVQKVTDTRKRLKYMNGNFMRKIISDKETKLPRKKLDLIDIIINKYPSIDLPEDPENIHVELHNSIAHLGFSIYKRLCSRYPSEQVDFSQYFL